MSAPSLPPLHLLPGCGHLFFPPEMVHSGFNGLSLNDAMPLGRLGNVGNAPNRMGPLAHLGQIGQLDTFSHLAALQIHACRSMPNPMAFTQPDCNSNTLRSYGSMGSLVSPGSEVASSPMSNQLRTTFGSTAKRPRGEKRPIPDEHKDDKYYERRKRNNQAAKKSRDARKIREDQIALRAAILEHENNVLRAQLLTLREEVRALRRLLLGRSSPHGSIINNHCSND